jgi:hypothetical protein
MAETSKSDLSKGQLVQAPSSVEQALSSQFQSGTLKLTSNLSVYQPQVSIVYHDHFTIVTWLSTHVIVHWLKRTNLRKRIFQLKIQHFVLTKNLAKQFVLVAKGIVKLNDFERKTIGGWIITYIRVRVRDVSRRHAHEAKVGEVTLLVLDLLILLWAGIVITGEVEVTEGSTRSWYDLLEFLLLLVPEAVLHFIVALTILVSLDVVILVGVELLPLGAVSDEVGGEKPSGQFLGLIVISHWLAVVWILIWDIFVVSPLCLFHMENHVCLSHGVQVAGCNTLVFMRK